MDAQKTLTTRERILQAASSIVFSEGVSRLTLENVAEKAELSKGGLLYHFPNKESIIKALIQQLTENFTAELENEQNSEAGSPGRWLRAYVRMTFEMDAQINATSAGLLAAATTDPDLMHPFQEAFQKWQGCIETDGIDLVKGTLIRLAVDGLWMADLLGLASPQGKLREEIFEALLAFIED